MINFQILKWSSIYLAIVFAGGRYITFSESSLQDCHLSLANVLSSYPVLSELQVYLHLRKGAVVWSARYNNGGVLRTARTVRNGRRLQHKVQSRTLRQGTVVRSCRYKKKEYCAKHAPNGMVNVKSRKCRTQGCVKAPLFEMAGTKTVVYCAQHAPDEMVDIKSRKFGT